MRCPGREKRHRYGWPVPTTLPVNLLADTKVLPPRGLNTSVYLDINSFARHTGWAHSFMHAYALWLGLALLVAGLVVAYALAWWRGAADAAALLLVGGVGTVVALGANQLVGHAAKELRPYATHPGALVLVSKANDYAFPSDHAVIGGALMAAVLLVTGGSVWSGQRRKHAAGTRPSEPTTTPGRPPGWWALVVADVVLGLFLCFSRVYVGAHYPGDVVGGLLLGIAVVAVLSLLRPVVFLVVDAVEPTVLGACFRRPRALVAAGHRSSTEDGDRASM